MPDDFTRLADDLDQADVSTDDSPPTSLTLVLDPPVEVDKKTFSSLHLVEPTGRQVQLAENEVGTQASFGAIRKYQFSLIARVGRVPVEVIHAMPISQINEAWGFLGPLVKGGPLTGGI
jgi:hypothetical protein